MQRILNQAHGESRGRVRSRLRRRAGVLAAAGVIGVAGGCSGAGSSYSSYQVGPYDASSGTRTYSGGAEAGIVYGIYAVIIAIGEAFAG